MPLNLLNRNESVVDENGIPTQKLQIFSEEVARFEILSGVGSPNGVVSARMKRLYMEELTGQLYIKRVNDIGGDTTMGWV